MVPPGNHVIAAVVGWDCYRIARRDHPVRAAQDRGALLSAQNLIEARNVLLSARQQLFRLRLAMIDYGIGMTSGTC